jgi:hypothetical protein
VNVFWSRWRWIVSSAASITRNSASAATADTGSRPTSSIDEIGVDQLADRFVDRVISAVGVHNTTDTPASGETSWEGVCCAVVAAGKDRVWAEKDGRHLAKEGERSYVWDLWSGQLHD